MHESAFSMTDSAVQVSFAHSLTVVFTAIDDQELRQITMEYSSANSLEGFAQLVDITMLVRPPRLNATLGRRYSARETAAQKRTYVHIYVYIYIYIYTYIVLYSLT